MKGLKQASSARLKRVLRGVAPWYTNAFPISDPLWQAKYHVFNLFTERKAREKLDYLHKNPVRAEQVEKAVDWRWSWAGYLLAA